MPEDDTRAEYKRIQLDWIKERVQAVWNIYIAFFEKCQDLGFDSDETNATTIAESRTITGLSIVTNCFIIFWGQRTFIIPQRMNRSSPKAINRVAEIRTFRNEKSRNKR